MSRVRLHFITPWAEYAYILLHEFAYNLLPQERVSAYTICYRMHWVRLHFVKWAEYAYNLLPHALTKWLDKLTKTIFKLRKNHN